jgi:hypothetical protein
MEAPENSYLKCCYNRLMQETEKPNLVTRLKGKFFPNVLENIWLSQSTRLNDFSWRQILDHHKTYLQQQDKERIAGSSSLYWYKHIADLEHSRPILYLKSQLPTGTISTFCQLRLLNKFNEKVFTNGVSHNFKNNQNCTICNLGENDTLIHLLTKCNITRNLRNEYLNSTTTDEIVDLLRDETEESISRVVKFVRLALKERSFILAE